MKLLKLMIVLFPLFGFAKTYTGETLKSKTCTLEVVNQTEKSLEVKVKVSSWWYSLTQTLTKKESGNYFGCSGSSCLSVEVSNTEEAQLLGFSWGRKYTGVTGAERLSVINECTFL